MVAFVNYFLQLGQTVLVRFVLVPRRSCKPILIRFVCLETVTKLFNARTKYTTSVWVRLLLLVVMR